MKTIKIIALAALSVLVYSQANSQAEYRSALSKGSILTGGSLAFSFGSTKTSYSFGVDSESYESKYSSVSLTPTAGFFIGNGLTLGLIVDLTSSTSKYEDDDSKETSTEYTVGPVFRYYTASGFFFHGDIGFGKMIEKYSGDEDSEKDEVKLLKWKAGIGYAFFLNDHVSIEPTIMYRVSQLKYDDDDFNAESKLGEFVIGVGLGVFLFK